MTPRGVALSGTFINPVDSGDAAVLFSHSFFANRSSGEHFDRLGRTYRAAGYATLAFDYSGHGASGDEIITVETQVEDLRAASGWLADQGFERQLLHGHAYGATVALAARPPAVLSMVLTSPVLGPRTFEWEEIFSLVQLDELEKHGATTIPDDLPGSRQHFTISKQTLVDLSMVDELKLLRGIDFPVLIVHDKDDRDLGLVEVTQDVFSLLSDGSRVEVINDASFEAGQRPEALSNLAVEWARLRLPLRRRRR